MKKGMVWVCILMSLGLLGLATDRVAGQSTKAKIITYGMAKPESVQSFGIAALRGKFNLKLLDSYEEGIIVLRNSNVYKMPIEAMVEEAKTYAELSKISKLTEVSIDDFVSWYVGAQREGKASVFDQIVQTVKTTNPKLRFGITVYEDQLPGASGYNTGAMTEAHRSKVDVVHLYFHQRPHCTNMAQYADVARRQFPVAQLAIGLYNQDRRKVEKRSSTEAEEQNMFTNCVKLASSLVASGQATAIEFYPGNFGLENNVYKGDPQAAQNATAMRESALAILKVGAR